MFLSQFDELLSDYNSSQRKQKLVIIDFEIDGTNLMNIYTSVLPTLFKNIIQRFNFL